MGRDNSVCKKIWNDNNLPLQYDDTFRDMMMNACRTHKYHSKNKHLLIHNPDIHKIWMLEDYNNMGCFFWRYYWMQNDIVYLYTGKGVLGKTEKELIELPFFVLDNTRVQVSNKGEGQYELCLETIIK